MEIRVLSVSYAVGLLGLKLVCEDEKCFACQCLICLAYFCTTSAFLHI